MMEAKLGLKENWQQFTLLVIVNAFVGGMVGLERSIIPQLAEHEFGIVSKVAILSFITAFGFSKAVANYFAGRFADKIGRKNLLTIGWLMALPIPFILIYANNWQWVIVANMLLGFSQGITWSSTVVMKMDLVGEKNRGLAKGLNEFAGYLSVGMVAFLTAYIADNYGIRPYPFYLGIFMAVVGLILSLFWVKDTRHFVAQEGKESNIIKAENVFWNTTVKDKTLSSVTQAGLINNLNDGMIWGLLPILLWQLKLSTPQIGIITAIYPSIWGVGQIVTGRLSDVLSKKKMLFWGMFLQGIAIILLIYTRNFYLLAILSALLGIGTALVYPTFLSSIGQATNPSQRAESIGVFRLWRDLGYAFGAIISGIIADRMGLNYAIVFIGVLTILSSIIIQVRMPEK
ncbi:MFS transporter [Arcicella lustrica]|uniref:MFS transporter n=1 Tax=Arcicella lustrica TaxID=2984196 RepID=A0ABU5SK61_9BACT|nr:MFS transporter [Arcicella sp. DC25W]MEA5427684.1 MFS transporter [Arcicella sp. DC25W]